MTLVFKFRSKMQIEMSLHSDDEPGPIGCPTQSWRRHQGILNDEKLLILSVSPLIIEQRTNLWWAHTNKHTNKDTQAHTYTHKPHLLPLPTLPHNQEAPVVFPVIDGNHKATVRGHSGRYNGVPLRKAGWKTP